MAATPPDRRHDTGTAGGAPGVPVCVWLRRGRADLPRDVDWILLAGDETALPAIGHAVEIMPPGLSATVVIEVAEQDHHQDLSSRADVDYVWLFRSENERRSRLVETVQSAPWRGERPYLCVAGETLTIKPLRRWAKQEKQLSKDRIEIAGYWRHREVSTVDGDPEVVDTSRDENATATIDEMTEILPPFAIRAGVTLGLFDAVDAGQNTAAGVAKLCGTDPAATEKLLRHLAVLGFFDRDGNGYRLTTLGEALTDADDLVTSHLHHDRLFTRRDLAFLHLVDAVRTGAAVPFDGSTFREVRAADTELADEIHSEAHKWATYRAPALPEAVDLSGVRTIAVTGDGPGVYARPRRIFELCASVAPASARSPRSPTWHPRAPGFASHLSAGVPRSPN